jgi:acyl carrier protein
MIRTPLEDRVRHIVATIFDVPPQDVTPQTARGGLERWDSLGHLVLVLELEQEFDIQLPPEQVERLNSVAEIAGVLGTDYHLEGSAS